MWMLTLLAKYCKTGIRGGGVGGEMLTLLSEVLTDWDCELLGGEV